MGVLGYARWKIPTTPAITVTAFADATKQSLIALKLGGRADNWAPPAGVCVHAGVPAGWAPRASVYTHALRGVWSREADEGVHVAGSGGTRGESSRASPHVNDTHGDRYWAGRNASGQSGDVEKVGGELGRGIHGLGRLLLNNNFLFSLLFCFQTSTWI